MEHTYVVRGMHCQACIRRATDALLKTAGVESAAVTLDPPQARVTMSRPVSLETLNESLQSAGDYRLAEPAPAALDALPILSATPASAAAVSESDAPRESLYPLALIVAYIAGACAAIALATGDWSTATLMRHFMAGFFLVFSFFKLLDLRGFAETYRTYDLLAGAWPAWGFIYPFVELALGVAYVVDWNPTATNVATLTLMSVGALGVLKALLNKRRIRCACLGTALNLPMTTVTLVEDLAMAAMALAMLAL